MLDISYYCKNLTLNDGIWRSDKIDNISYPAEGNKNYFKIEDESFWFKHRNNVILRAVKKFHLEGAFFDIGGGNGLVASKLQENGLETILVEPGIEGCLNAKNRNVNTIINTLFSCEYFLNDSICNIGVFDVIEHIEDHEGFLKEIYKALVKNGILFMTIPAFMLLWSEEDVYAGHYRRYNLEQINKLQTSVGFKILYSTYFFSFLQLPVFFFRTLPSKVGFYKVNSKQTKKQHSYNSKTGFLLNALMNYELIKISKFDKIPFGSSCLTVSKKI